MPDKLRAVQAGGMSETTTTDLYEVTMSYLREGMLASAGCADVIGLSDEQPPDGTVPLLRTVMRDGRRTGPPDTLAAARARFEADLVDLPEAARLIHRPESPVPTGSPQLKALTSVVRDRLKAASAAPADRSG
ncbi:hypothetical protein Slala04_37320 [Streptomyces lavendulae subsp. lavendulae]|uniref:hypothetical protein n=1 Tax=Streptomyces TaxID=1883 RepID=UPI0004BDC818|nr:MULTISPECIES: hypothetical protein [Streptomyces]KOU96437.1 hypothetical protein ADK92_17395 [Streptomyces sp. XY533]MCI4084682.1 hypothetical protein [Streptomyces sp. MMS21 TC-5]GLV92278.1 hypothetical protein Slala04_37320 [Streptomyces lavendulae subsp. lavendulae]